MSTTNPTNHIPIKGGNLQPRSKLYIISGRIFLETVKIVKISHQTRKYHFFFKEVADLLHCPTVLYHFLQ